MLTTGSHQGCLQTAYNINVKLTHIISGTAKSNSIKKHQKQKYAKWREHYIPLNYKNHDLFE